MGILVNERSDLAQWLVGVAMGGASAVKNVTPWQMCTAVTAPSSDTLTCVKNQNDAQFGIRRLLQLLRNPLGGRATDCAVRHIRRNYAVSLPIMS